MSVPNRGQLIAAAWEDYVKTDPADQIFNFFWLLENLKTGNSFQKGSGDPITGTIEYNTNSTVKAMSELETLDINRVDVFDRYEYPWKFVGGDIVMSEFEKLVTAGGAGKFDLEAGKIDNLKKTMQQQINGDLFSDGTGVSGKQAGGCSCWSPRRRRRAHRAVSIAPSTPSGGTSRRAGTKSATAFDNLRGTMRSIYNLCSSGVGMQTPEFAVTDRTDYEGYESLLTSNERIVRSAVDGQGAVGLQGRPHHVQGHPRVLRQRQPVRRDVYPEPSQPLHPLSAVDEGVPAEHAGQPVRGRGEDPDDLQPRHRQPASARLHHRHHVNRPRRGESNMRFSNDRNSRGRRLRDGRGGMERHGRPHAGEGVRVFRNSFTKTATITAASFVRGNPVLIASASNNGYDVVHADTAGQPVNDLFCGVVADYPDTTSGKTGVWQPEDFGIVQTYGVHMPWWQTRR
jgi:hypothetical protein